MSLSDDPEISAAFTEAPAPAAQSGAVDDPEISSAFASMAPKGPYRGGAFGTPVDEVVEHELKSLGASAVAGVHTIHDWLTGKVKTIAEADKLAQADIKKYGPSAPEKGSTAEKIEGALSSNYNPLNWPSWALAEGGKLTQKGLEAVGVPSQYSTIAGAGTEAAGNVALGTYGAVKALGLGKTAPIAESAPRVEPTMTFEPNVVAEPAEGGLGLNDAQRGQRAQVLSRVGIENARESALTGDRLNAATDYQLTKFNQEPAGKAAAAQFEHEKQALTTHAENIVKETGGSIGTDQDALQTRGRTIAEPFDKMREWFDARNKEDYAVAQSRASQRGSMGDTLPSVDKLLEDPSFKETLLAKDQGGLLGSVQRQYENFKKTTGGVWTPESAENFRKWLNQTWTPQNSKTIGTIKGAIDNDVFKAAGDDIYGPARQRVMLEHTLLDDPKGISKAFDFDPQTPMNRATAFNKIPDFLTGLAPDQLKHVVQTLKNMPEEIQPEAKQALAEIRAHYANKILEAGSSTQGQWNAPKVSQVLKNNSANMKIAFEDAPELMPKIEDLNAAGRILKTDQSYPGAAAQASSALKRGMMSHVLTRAASTTGAVVGGAVGSAVGAPVTGAAVGAGAGEALALRAARSSAEKAALKNWEGRTVRLSDLVKERGGSARP